MDPGFIRRGSRISRKMGSKKGSKSGQKPMIMGCQNGGSGGTGGVPSLYTGERGPKMIV